MKEIELEYWDGEQWRWKVFVTFSQHNLEDYCLCIGKNFIISFYSTYSDAHLAKDNTDTQLYLVGCVAKFFGVGPTIHRIRPIKTDIEIKEAT